MFMDPSRNASIEEEMAETVQVRPVKMYAALASRAVFRMKKFVQCMQISGTWSHTDFLVLLQAFTAFLIYQSRGNRLGSLVWGLGEKGMTLDDMICRVYDIMLDKKMHCFEALLSEKPTASRLAAYLTAACESVMIDILREENRMIPIADDDFPPVFDCYLRRSDTSAILSKAMFRVLSSRQMSSIDKIMAMHALVYNHVIPVGGKRCRSALEEDAFENEYVRWREAMNRIFPKSQRSSGHEEQKDKLFSPKNISFLMDQYSVRTALSFLKKGMGMKFSGISFHFHLCEATQEKLRNMYRSSYVNTRMKRAMETFRTLMREELTNLGADPEDLLSSEAV